MSNSTSNSDVSTENIPYYSLSEGLERLQVQMVATLLSTVLLGEWSATPVVHDYIISPTCVEGTYTLCAAYAAQILMCVHL